MKKLLVIFAALICGAALEAQTQPDLVARIHFLGGDKISTDTNSAAFANEFTSPEARALENQTLDKLSKFFATQLKSTNDAAQLRPLLDDLLKSEWVFEMRESNYGSPEFELKGSFEFMLAINLSSERGKFWVKNLATIFHDHDPKWLNQTNIMLVQMGPDARFSNDWVIVNCGQHKVSLGEEFTKEFQKPNFFKTFENSSTNWLEADLNWPQLAQLFPSLREFDFPKVAFQIVGRDGNFHWTGKLNLSQPLPPLENWRMPTNVIHQPFVSFTAARGVATWLEKQSWFQPYVVQPQPEQIFVWALAQVPFQTFAAEPVANANAALEQLHNNLAANQNWQSQFMMPIRLTLTNNQLSFAGVPFIASYIRADHESDGDFLFGGFFPNTPRSKPLPPELFEQLSAPNLVYYHWEITAERLQELPELSQLLLMATKHRQLDGKSVAHAWLNRFVPALGNFSAVTIITETSPTELSFTRKAPGGLTAEELLALANWLESPNFPAPDLRLPPRPRIPARAHAPTPLMSVPVPPAKK